MPATPFQIKICGITRVEDLVDAVVAGADAVGLNFYPQSRRYVQDLRTPPMDELRRRLDHPVQVVGVFVNESLRGIGARCGQYALSAIQLHGDEPPELLAQLPAMPIIRARRLDDRGPAAVADDLAACQAAGRLPDAVLVDALTPGQYGGTGETVSWTALADYPRCLQDRGLGEVPLILAGGLTPENVAEAIDTVRPAGVDVASGVEKSPGVKDPDKVARFVAAAKSAFAAM